MPWISYAQNAEDVRLRRAFRDQSTGFYIDVGANDPVVSSITKYFYESGWTGINVEPAPGPYALITNDRRRDVNLNVGCSNKAGSMRLYVARGATGLSTFTAGEADQHRKNGYAIDPIDVPVMTLESICAEHVKERVIDFLSIDVEGHERQVLEGADFRRYRPRVIVIEATRPNTTEPTYERWEELITSHDYVFVVFDGLNRYYVRREDEKLVPIVALAPNVFDDFEPYAFRHYIETLESQLSSYRAASATFRAFAGAMRGVAKFGRLFIPSRRRI
jgi:FkbM family methyltransferase